MASDHFKLKSHWRSDRENHTEHVMCNRKESESTMKFSSKHLESPPPKPPRRRYSDQLSVSSLGTYSSNKKHNEEAAKVEPRLKEHNPRPVYLSLPANLTSKLFTECNDTPVSHSQSFCLLDQLKNSREEQFYAKNTIGDIKLAERVMKQENASSAEKSQDIDYDQLFQYKNSISNSHDKFSQNSSCSNKVFMPDKCTSKNIQSFHKDCHRRHHSDPIISYFNLQNEDVSPEFEQKPCWDHIYSSSRKVNKFCDYTESCACCKKSYLIMQEIKILKEINEKLWQHLCSLQNYVQSMQKKSYDECADVSISGLLSSIYYAQKAKDCAMEERIKIAHEERDSALLELDDLIQFMTKSFDCVDREKAEKDIKELVTETGCTTNLSKLLKHQRMLLVQIHKLKESKQECLLQQLKQAETERDGALDKVRKLEEEVKDLKLSYDIWHFDNKHWEFSIFDMLNQLMHQRDTVLSKIDYSLDLSNIKCWPPKTGKLESLEHQNSSFESRSKRIESIKSHYLSDYKPKHSFGTSDEVAKLKEEIFVLNKSLESEMKKKEMAEGKCVKLERITHILRRKLNGQNIGVPV